MCKLYWLVCGREYSEKRIGEILQLIDHRSNVWVSNYDDVAEGSGKKDIANGISPVYFKPVVVNVKIDFFVDKLAFFIHEIWYVIFIDRKPKNFEALNLNLLVIYFWKYHGDVDFSFHFLLNKMGIFSFLNFAYISSKIYKLLSW